MRKRIQFTGVLFFFALLVGCGGGGGDVGGVGEDVGGYGIEEPISTTRDISGTIVSYNPDNPDISLQLLKGAPNSGCGGISKVIATAMDGTTVISDTLDDCTFVLPLIVDQLYVISFVNPSGNFIATLFGSYGSIFEIPADTDQITLGTVTISNGKATFSDNFLRYIDSDGDGTVDSEDDTPCGTESCSEAYSCVRHGHSDADNDGICDPWDDRIPGSSRMQNDYDEDGVHNAKDNCPHTSNADQEDMDSDGLGDACDGNNNNDNNDDGDSDGDPLEDHPNGNRDACVLTYDDSHTCDAMETMTIRNIGYESLTIATFNDCGQITICPQEVVVLDIGTADYLLSFHSGADGPAFEAVADDTAPSLSAMVSHFVGPLGGIGSEDGTGTVARFNNPYGMTSDGTNLYVTDYYSHTIRKIEIASGVVTTLAGTAGLGWAGTGSSDGTGAGARFNYPAGITNDGTNLYVADSGNGTIRKIVIATGVVTTFAGDARYLYGGHTDGIGTAALFYRPHGITCDGTNLYVADTYNHSIRKIVIATREVTTFAGTGGHQGSTDGIGPDARFYLPSGITTDNTNLYVTDRENHTIRKIVIATREVTTLAGTADPYNLEKGSADGTGTAARFYYPDGIATDGINVYVADVYNQTIRKIVIETGEVTTFAGAAGVWGAEDGVGTDARFYFPQGVVIDGTDLYVADTSNNIIRKIVIASGEVTTFAGMEGRHNSTDGTGATARFDYSLGITSDGTNLYMTDTGNATVRKVEIATGIVTTIAGTARATGSSDGMGSAARFYIPTGITSDGDNLYVTDPGNYTIRKIVIETGEVTTVAGTAGDPAPWGGGGFNEPLGITNDGTNLYVADGRSATIRKIDMATGAVTTFAGWASQQGSTDGIGNAARFYKPYGIICDGTDLYVTDQLNSNIRKIEIATREVTTIAGGFDYPRGITSDGANLYVADTGNHIIRKIAIDTGAVTTYAGMAGLYGSTDGIATMSRFYSPYALTYVGITLYVTEGNGDVRMIEVLHPSL